MEASYSAQPAPQTSSAPRLGKPASHLSPCLSPFHRSSHSFAPYPTTRPSAHPLTELCMAPTMGIISIPIKPLRFIREPGWNEGGWGGLYTQVPRAKKDSRLGMSARGIYTTQYTQASETTWVPIKAGNFAVTLLVGMIAIRFVVDGSGSLFCVAGCSRSHDPGLERAV